MIKNEEQIEEYTQYNKIYIPNDLYNEQYRYILTSDNVQIITNLNCRTQNTQKYCTCYIYDKKDNIRTNAYECRADQTNNSEINFTQITNDINYSDKITNKYVNDYIIMFGELIIVGIFLISMKKNGRKI